MIISALPDPARHDGGTPSEQKNSVLFSFSKKKYFYPKHPAPYLLATNFLNKGHYVLNGQRIVASEKCFYLLNAGDEFAINFNDPSPLKTLFVFFNEAFFSGAVYALRSPDDQLLDDPADRCGGEFKIPGVPFTSNPGILQLFHSISGGFLSPPELEDRLFDLVAEFFKCHRATSLDLNKIKARKTATREELYRRLYIAYEFIKDNVTLASLTVDEMAGVACMNKFHFLKNFRELYGLSPHQYLIELKLQRAYLKLKNGNTTVAAVCHEVGFESAASFSNLFKRRFNTPPSSVLTEGKVPNFR